MKTKSESAKGVCPTIDGELVFKVLKPKLLIGELVETSRARKVLNREDVIEALSRHSVGDWGEVDKEDWEENELGLKEGFRLFSVYKDRNGNKFWIITEADRSVTTVSLPEDY